MEESPSTVANRGSSFHKFFKYILLTLLVLTILYLFILLNLLSFSFGMPLAIRPSEVSVSKLNVSEKKITAKFSTVYSIHNPNTAYGVEIMTNRGTLYYKDIEPLAATSEPHSFDLKEGEVATRRSQFSTGLAGERPALVTPNVLKSISKELKNGVVQFSLKMRILTEYKAGPFFWKVGTIFMCKGLNVQFNKTTGTGELIKPVSRNCTVEEFRHLLF